MIAVEPISLTVARVVRQAEARNQDLAAFRIVRDWRDAAEDGLTLADAAKRLGRDPSEGRKVAARHRFRFASPDRRRLPEMSHDEMIAYRRMLRKGVGRADALAVLGLEDRPW